MSRSSMEKQFRKRLHMDQQLGGAPIQNAYPAGQYPGYEHMSSEMYSHMMAGYADPTTGAIVGYAPLPAGPEDEEEEPDKKNVVPLYGNTSNYNINTLLFDNIMGNEYFRALYSLRTYHEVIYEVERSVKHVEPWQTGTRFPSSAFCLLVKFFVMKLTVKQMNGLLGYENCVFVRALGLLYLRFAGTPADLWKWFEPFLEDDEIIQPAADKSVSMTLGQYCVKLLTDNKYYGTTLPRIPLLTERKIKVMLLLLEEKKKRRQQNERQLDRFHVGSKVQAIYGDDTNEPAWYEAVIDSIDEGRYWVTFPEYGNSECVDLGDMQLVGSSAGESRQSRSQSQEAGRDASGRDRSRDRSKDRRSSDRDRQHRGRDDSRDRDRDRHRDRDSRDREHRDRNRDRDRDRYHDGRDRDRERSRDRDRDRGRDRGRDSRDRNSSRSSPARGSLPVSTSAENLLEKVLASERDATAAVGRNYANRPLSFKGSLSTKLQSSCDRRGRGNSRSRSRDRAPRDRDRNDRSGDRRNRGGSGSSSYDNGRDRDNAAPDRMKMLREKYGDASALTK